MRKKPPAAPAPPEEVPEIKIPAIAVHPRREKKPKPPAPTPLDPHVPLLDHVRRIAPSLPWRESSDPHDLFDRVGFSGKHFDVDIERTETGSCSLHVIIGEREIILRRFVDPTEKLQELETLLLTRLEKLKIDAIASFDADLAKIRAGRA